MSNLDERLKALTEIDMDREISTLYVGHLIMSLMYDKDDPELAYHQAKLNAIRATIPYPKLCALRLWVEEVTQTHTDMTEHMREVVEQAALEMQRDFDA